jgi:hypothetical protein
VRPIDHEGLLCRRVDERQRRSAMFSIDQEIGIQRQDGGAPVARTGVLRARPAVAWSAMPRTVPGSTWLCTSRISGSERSHSTTKAVLIGGSA